MKFDTKIILGTSKLYSKKTSLTIEFVIDDETIEEQIFSIENKYHAKISSLQKKKLKSDFGKVNLFLSSTNEDELQLVRIKADEKFSVNYFRNYFAGFLPTLKKSLLASLRIIIPAFEKFNIYFDSEEYFYQTFIEGIHYGSYEFDKYKTEKKPTKKLDVIVFAQNQSILKEAITTANTLMYSVKFTRDLQNEPSNILTPKIFSSLVKKEFKNLPVEVIILNEKEIQQEKMGGLLAVSAGSKNLPRFIILKYDGTKKIKTKSEKDKLKFALVGKGITFDSGGISLKPAQEMWKMKGDMSGAAVVAGTILTAVKLNLPINVFGIIPLAENMPSGSSMKPGDIIKTFSGKSVEIDNTDAEGRLILADALHFASLQKPNFIIDLATLTGACVVALGEFVAGLFSNDDSLANNIFNSGLKTYEKAWRLPLWNEFESLNKSEVADIKNVGGKGAGAITAAKFLETFVDKNISWAHIDIAGPSMPNDSTDYSKKYLTGFGVRLLFEVLKMKLK